MSTYLVIGGSSGIGKEVVKTLSAEGHSVLATYNEHKQPDSASVHYYPLNVLDQTVDLSFLPKSIDGLVYCPGSIDLKPFNRIKPQDFYEDYELQVGGAVKVIQSCLNRLKNSNNASVVLYSTVAVQSGFSFHSKVSASKGAIEGLVRALAAEYAPRIRFNVVAPSITDTPLAERLLSTEEKVNNNAMRHPMKRVGKAEDIADITSFLLSERSSWITGQILHVDGGLSVIK